MKRTCWSLAVFAFLVLGAAAVWMGGLNQDEGWYLYAASLVKGGAVPYRDFFYTQGPLLPVVYSVLAWSWESWGLLGARLVTLALGTLGLVCAVLLARALVPRDRRGEVTLLAFMLQGCNLYHLYYLAIPKTYALASLFLLLGFCLLAQVEREGFPFARLRAVLLAAAGGALAFAAGARISLGAALAVVGFGLLIDFRRRRWDFLWFGLGGALGLAAVYGPFLLIPAARDGLLAAQRYHAARSGFDLVWTVGSLSRLVRWYLPTFIVFGLGVFTWARQQTPRRDDEPANPVGRLLALALLAVFVLQMLAPFPYEDYQVPLMGGFAALAAALLVGRGEATAEAAGLRAAAPLLSLGLCFATAFGCPLLEKWTTNGQDRFWTLKKTRTELAQLRDVARRIETLDPGGTTLLTQDLYLAVETRRTVPAGLEMGPFSILTDAQWRELLARGDCPVAALSGYTFAIEPPACTERPMGDQLAYWSVLKSKYELAFREEAFGQNATPLLVLKRK